MLPYTGSARHFLLVRLLERSVASVSFEISEPSCASFDLSFAADRQVVSAQLNGRPLTVPSHGFLRTTAQEGKPGLRAERGVGLFAHGRNNLVVYVENDAGALGLYVSGNVQLLCPLDEAMVTMRPASGPAGAFPCLARAPPSRYRAYPSRFRYA